MPALQDGNSYRHEMTWVPLIGTLLGAVIALSSGVLVERRRERRENRLERRRTKQEVYARYLAAHADTRTQLRILSLASGLTDEERGHRAFTAYAACYSARYELAVPAPEAVPAPARAFDRESRDLRDLLIAGTQVPTPGGDGMRRYLDALDVVHTAMRADLGTDENS
jgi:hypothetical protein